MEKFVEPFKRGKNVFEYEAIDLVRTFPEWKSPLLSADYMFIQTYKELNSVQKKLKEKEKEIEFHNTEMTNKWIELKRKQEEFIVDVENYNKFFIENEQKCQRVNGKIKSEMFLQSNNEREIEDIEKRIEYLEKIENEMNTSITTLKPFHEFLYEIAQETAHFNDVNNLINYYILLNSETKLQEKFSSNLLGCEQLHTQLLNSLKNKINSVTEGKHELFEVQKDFQAKMNELNQWNEKLRQQKKQYNDCLEETVLVKQACDNVLQKLCKWKRINLKNVDEDQKLTFIENTIKELQNAVQLAYNLSYKNNVSCKAESSFISLKRML